MGLVFGYMVDQVSSGKPAVDQQEVLLREKIKFLDEMKGRLGDIPQPAVRSAGLTLPKIGAVDTDPTDACTVCALKHLSRASGFLNEASQMLASYDFVDPSIQMRVDTAAENLGLLEDHDWSDTKLAASPLADQKLVGQFAPRVRTLRKEILMCGQPERLRVLAGEMRKLSTEYRTAFLQHNGLDFGSKGAELDAASTGQ